MSDQSYGFLSEAAETIMRRLVGGIASDVENERVGRSRALDRLSDALERTADCDGAQPEQVVLDVLAKHLEPAFAKGGFIALTGTEIRAHWDSWSRGGVPSGPLDACPEAVIQAAASARAAVAAADALATKHGLSVAGSALNPWDKGFCAADGAPPADIVLFPWRGEPSGTPMLGCVLISGDGGVYIEDAGGSGGLVAKVRAGLLDLAPGADAAGIASDLKALHDGVVGCNGASARVNDPSRFALEVLPGDGAAVCVTWDGERVTADTKPTRRAATSAPRRTGSAIAASQVPMVATDAFDHMEFAGNQATEHGQDAPPAPGMR